MSLPSSGKNLLNRKHFWRVASIAVSVALMLYILAHIEFDQFLDMVRGVPVWVLLLVFGIYMALNFFRTLRFLTFMGKDRPSVTALFPIVLYHNFLVRTLPFKAGELSYIILLNRYLKQPVTEGISSLVSARMFELGLVILGGAFGLLSLGEQPLEQRLVWFAAILVFLIAYIIALYYSGSIIKWFARLWTRFAAPLVNPRFPKLENLVEQKLHVFAEQFDRIHNPRLLLQACVLSFCTYSMSVLFDIVLMRGLGLPHETGVLLTIISIKMFIEGAPIAVSGFGVIEGGWTLGLVNLAGLPMEQAAAIALFLHVCQVIMAGLVGLIGYALLPHLTRRETPPAEVPAS